MEEEDIEAQIERELLEIIDLEKGNDDSTTPEDVTSSEDEISNNNNNNDDLQLASIADYIAKMQNQSDRFEKELMECDELLQGTSREPLSSRVEHEELLALAEEQSIGVEELKQQVLQEIQEEDKKEESYRMTNVAKENVLELMNQAQLSSREDNSSGAFFITTNAEVKHQDNRTNEEQTPSNTEETTQLAVVAKEGVDNDEPNIENEDDGIGTVAQIFDSDGLERQLMQQVWEMDESRKRLNEQRLLEITSIKHETEERENVIEEQRKLKHMELDKEKVILQEESEKREQTLHKEAEMLKREIEDSLKVFERDLDEKVKQAANEKRHWEGIRNEESKKKVILQEKSAIKIQAVYRGYRVRKADDAGVKEVIAEVRKERYEQKIEEYQILIDDREERRREKEEEEKLQTEIEEDNRRELEEEKKLKIEAEKLRKEEEKRLKEEMKLKKVEEDRKKKEEEKRRKEELRLQKEMEEKQKKEEEKRRKEELKRQKEEEKRRKEEEKRRKEEEKIQKEEEEKRRKEEEKRKKEEEEEERRKEKEEEERIRIEEEKKKLEWEEKRKEVIIEAKKDDDVVIKGESVTLTKSMTDMLLETVCDANNVNQENDKHSSAESSPKLKTSKTPRPPSMEKPTGAVYERPLSAKSKLALNTSNSVQTDFNKSSVASCNITPVNIVVDNTRKSIKSQHELAKTNRDWGETLPQPIEQKRLAWIKECKPISQILSNHRSRKPGSTKNPRRRSSAASNLPFLDEGLILTAANVQSFKQVTTVELHDLPGCTLKSLSPCVHLRSLCMSNCNLVSTEGLEQCRNLEYVNLKNNKLEVLSFKDLSKLLYLDVSNNSIGLIHGIDGCTELRYLDMSHNHITKMNGLDSVKNLHTLLLSHNQLTSTHGLDRVVTVQCLDVSHNHLSSVDDLDKLALLQELVVSGNNLMQVPKLTNNVLLNKLILNDNSISFLSGLSQTWLPLLSTMSLNQNNVNMLDPMLNLLLLETLDLSNNQVVSIGNVLPGLCATRYLLSLNLQGNPLCADTGYRANVLHALPYVNELDNQCTTPTITTVTRTQFELLCQSQKDQFLKLHQQYSDALKKSNSAVQEIEVHTKFFDSSHQLATDIRYTHEYGISMTQPKEIDFDFDVTSPEVPQVVQKPVLKSGLSPLSNDIKSMFANALTSANSGSKKPDTSSDMKNKFDEALKHSTTGLSHSLNAQNSSMSSSMKNTFEDTLKQSTVGSVKSRVSIENNSSISSDMKNKFEAALKNPTSSQLSGINTKNNNGNSDRNGQLMNGGTSYNRFDLSSAKTYSDGDGHGKANISATKIQAWWRGNYLRKQLELAYEYVKMTDLDEDLENFGEIDLNEFNFNMNDFENDLMVPDLPQIPRNLPVLGKPPMAPPIGKTTSTYDVPPLFNKNKSPPGNPTQAWRNPDSALSDYENFGGKPRLQALSRMSDNHSIDTHRSKKSEKIADDWGFKETKTAEMMYARAKKLKYNAVKKKKLSLLDPKQRLALFRRLEESSRPPPIQAANRHRHVPRKEYFRAREEEIKKQDFVKRVETHAKGERTFEWVHTQVANHDLNSSRGQPINHGSGGIYGSEGNLPRMDATVVAGGRTHFVNSPVSMDLQSIGSASTIGEVESRPRKLSSHDKLPPIRNNSNSAPKERMTFRNPKTEIEVGWGGGRKRNK